MIKTLVKLANLLDKRGNYKMAADVDCLIEKLSQMVGYSKQPEPEKNESLPEDGDTQSFEPAKQEVSVDPAQMAAGKPAQLPAKKRPLPLGQKEVLVNKVQKNLGIPPTGKWDKETNDKFVALLNTTTQYSKMFDGGKFKGSLKDAVQITDRMSKLNDNLMELPEEPYHDNDGVLPVPALENLPYDSDGLMKDPHLEDEPVQHKASFRLSR